MKSPVRYNARLADRARRHGRMQRQFHNPRRRDAWPRSPDRSGACDFVSRLLDKLTVHEGRRRQKTATAAISAVTGYWLERSVGKRHTQCPYWPTWWVKFMRYCSARRTGEASVRSEPQN